eukprot:gene9862-13269_t
MLKLAITLLVITNLYLSHGYTHNLFNKKSLLPRSLIVSIRHPNCNTNVKRCQNKTPNNREHGSLLSKTKLDGMLYISPILTEACFFNFIPAIILKLSKQKSLTNEGLIHSTLLGIGLWTFLGFQGWLVGVIYFILGSLATKIRMKEKEKLGIAEKRGGARGPENVWGSAAVAMICALLTYIAPRYDAILRLGFVTAFSTKLADTLGSEIGKAFGKTTYLITTFRSVPKGTEGAVSLEGTIAGIIGSIIIATFARSLNVIKSTSGVGICVLSSFIATNIESLIGAMYQDNVSWLSNELVNLIMTAIGAVLAMSLFSLM